MPKALLVSPGHQASPGRTADGGRDVAIGEANSVFGQTVNMGRTNIIRSLISKVCPPKIIRQKDDNVWLILCRKRNR